MPQSPSDKDTSMSNSQEPNGDAASATSTQAALAQAYKDIAMGEQHATALEASLTSLEGKLDALLASIEGGPAMSAASQNKSNKKQQEPQAKE
ncbi:hypothetical protein GGR53DRAFT_99288 [Hypoxylon sp. FL1150]|nr:hypothetical protein GGR53DRAFT_99288 [Hypoxylon sp. FL1150]